MKDILKQLQSSSVSQEDQDEWKQLSDLAIRVGKVESLSENGLFQAVSLVGWHFSTDAMLYANGAYNKEDWSHILTVKAPLMDKIHETIALSSGVHPVIISELAQIKAGHYDEIYLQQV